MKRGHGLHTTSLGDVVEVVDVDLDEIGAVVGRREALKERCDLLARAAPGGREVDGD